MMIAFDKNALTGMSRFYRANLINCLSGTKPALLIGTVSKDGDSNLALFSSVVHLGADPALIAFVQRPLTETSHTYQNILETGYYTINHVPPGKVAAAHHTSAKFPKGVSEFAACGFEEEAIDGFRAPFIKESPVKWGMQFVREVFFPENNTRLMIGAVDSVYLDEGVLLEDGNLDLIAAGSVAAAGLETYHTIHPLDKFAYAKADTVPTSSLKLK